MDKVVARFSWQEAELEAQTKALANAYARTGMEVEIVGLQEKDAVVAQAEAHQATHLLHVLSQTQLLFGRDTKEAGWICVEMPLSELIVPQE